MDSIEVDISFLWFLYDINVFPLIPLKNKHFIDKKYMVSMGLADGIIETM